MCSNGCIREGEGPNPDRALQITRILPNDAPRAQVRGAVTETKMRMPQRMLIVAAAALPVLLGCATAVEAPTPTAVARQPSALGFYSLEQAARGRRKFRQVCSECHFVSEFRGPDFESEWRRRTAWDLFRQVVRTMPEDNPGGLTQQTYADVIAYILQLNAYASGDAELVPSQDAMDAIPLGPGAANRNPGKELRDDR